RPLFCADFHRAFFPALRQRCFGNRQSADQSRATRRQPAESRTLQAPRKGFGWVATEIFRSRSDCSRCAVRNEALGRQACGLRVADGTSVSLAPTAFPQSSLACGSAERRPTSAIFANTHLVGRDSVEPLSLSQLKLSSVKCFSAFQALEFGVSLGSEFWILGFLEAHL